jgi:hypothetical protein
MRSSSTRVAPVIAAVIGALVFIVTVCGSSPPRRVISSRWRRVGSVTFWVALAAWSVWLLHAAGLISWSAAGIVMELPWYGWLALLVLVAWVVGVLDNHWPRYRATRAEPDLSSASDPAHPKTRVARRADKT